MSLRAGRMRSVDDRAARVEVCLPACDEPLRHAVEQHVLFRLGHLEPTLKEVTVCLSTLPGGRHRCRMQTHALPWASIVVQEDDCDQASAIDRASSRLEDAIRVVTGMAHERHSARAVAGSCGFVPVVPDGKRIRDPESVLSHGGEE